MKNKKIKCDIYTRVSTTMQVDGYSLDAQKEKLKRYAEFQNMEIVNEYSDEGKSGKSVEGRPEFQRMLDNIENGTDEVQFVLVFKLSRFGRNAADVLNSLQRMQDFGVNLICVEDGIDSSKDSGKLMISVLGYSTFFWSLAYVDWIQDQQPSREEAFQKLLGRIHPGAIVLLHNTSSTNGLILDDLLTKWEEMGYRFCSLKELTGA